MHERQLGCETLVGEVGVERLELQRRDHALVDQGAARQRAEVDVEFAFDPLACAERLTVEQDPADRSPGLPRSRTGDEELLDRGHGVARERSDLVRPHGDVAPPDDDQFFLFGDGLDRSLHGRAFARLCRKERVAHGVATDGREVEAGDRAKERIRNLSDDARAVAGAGVRAHRSTVLEVAQRAQRGIDDVVSGGAAERRHHGEPARVLLEGGVVETLPRGNRAESGLRA